MAVPDVIEAIAKRRTTRRFDPDRPLNDEILAKILKLATMAPSADNLQPWRFVVVRSRRNRERLRASVFGRVEVVEASAAVIVLGYRSAAETDLEAMLAERLRRGAISPQEAAEARAVVPRSARIGDPTLWATRSAMRAAATLLLAAEGLGVASAMIEPFDEPRLRADFGIPDDHVPCGVIALGFAVESPPFPGRFGLDHVCYEEHFGQPWTRGSFTAEIAEIAETEEFE